MKTQDEIRRLEYRIQDLERKFRTLDEDYGIGLMKAHIRSIQNKVRKLEMNHK